MSQRQRRPHTWSSANEPLGDSLGSSRPARGASFASEPSVAGPSQGPRPLPSEDPSLSHHRRRHDSHEPLRLTVESDAEPSSSASSSQADSSVVSPSLPYCHSIRLPLFIGPQPCEPFLLRLCIHPDWEPNPDSVVHLIRDLAAISGSDLHSPPLVEIDYEPVDLWQVHQRFGTLDGPATINARRSASPVVDTLLDRGSGAVEAAVDTSRPGPGPSRLVFVSTLICVLLVLSQLLFSVHPVFIYTLSVNQTANFTLWQPVHHVSRSYGYDLLPLIARFEIDGPVPYHTNSILAAALTEFEELRSGLAGWEGSSLPGPEASLRTNIDDCIRQLEVMQVHYRLFFTNADHLATASTVKALVAKLGEIDDQEDALSFNQAVSRAMVTYWSLMKERNLGTLHTLQQIDERLRDSAPKMRLALDEVAGKLGPHLHDPHRWWVKDPLDAVNYTREYLIPVIYNNIHPLIDRALVTLSTADVEITTQLKDWQLMYATDGVRRETRCRSTNDSTTWYSTWFVTHEERTTFYSADHRDGVQLANIATSGGVLANLIHDEEREAFVYRNVRPKRPRYQ
ncbi:hypothetical protein FZEAL_10279 [Fusarium zealandicum]|uniref:Uncharacterized protein n=1 Tax=Fusarium zealandicum TaxID=1053134 RepID=A0A8H4XBM5_9HYPO|nr:hypothetical protein FZEAL_10279 [Fusarium zealandicum]